MSRDRATNFGPSRSYLNPLRQRALWRLRTLTSPSGPRDDLLARLPRGSIGAEVGVWEGEFSWRILKTVSPRTLYLIDPWLFVPEYSDALYGGAVARSQMDMDAVYRGVKEQLGRNPRVRILRMPSSAAAEELERLDWVYIDGDHTYAAVRADLEAYAGILVGGGILCGDDYGVVDWWDDGVTRAVDEFAKTRCLAVERLGTQFLVQLPDS